MIISSNNPLFSDLLRSPRLLLAFGFGSGLSPKAPGTVGTLVAIPIWLLMSQLAAPLYWIVVFLAFVLGIYLCDYAAKALQTHDHGGIVWDEFVGFWIVMPFLSSGISYLESLFWGFVLFRFFDIVKPWPIGWLDRKVKGGLGIMLDDVVAGLYAALVALLVGYLGFI
jgi:phosphatidylglycerophosphatase A